MPGKALLFGDEARRSLKRGIDVLASAVGGTLGPAGRNVALDRRFGLPLIVNDGVTVARDIELSDPVENLGAVLLREAATKTEEAAGDGTTTATVLAQAILDVGFRHLAFGADALQIKRGLDTGRDAVVGAIRAAAIPLTDRAQSAHVAAISASDPQIGQLVAKVLDRVGTDGAVDIEESRTLRHEVEYVQGLAFDRGYLSAYFVTDPERMSCVIDKPRILVTGGEMSAVTDLVPILELLVAAGERSLIVLAGDVRGEALATLVVNRLRGTLEAVAVKAPEFGDRRRDVLGDLATVTGATILGAETGRALREADLTDLGRAQRAVVTPERTTIVGGAGDRRMVRRRVKALRAQLAEAASDDEREQLRRRLARLRGSVAVIRIGSATEVEFEELRHRFEDALLATRAALEEGVVPGGGATLLHAIGALRSLTLAGDAAVGVECLRRALREPMRRIADNAGYDDGLVVTTVQERQAGEGGSIGRRSEWAIRRHGRGRHRGPGEGRAQRGGERRLGCVDDPPRRNGGHRVGPGRGPGSPDVALGMTQAVTVGLCGQAVLADRLLNKDTAFSEEECDGLGLRGLLPPGVLTLEQQVCLELGHVHRKSDSDLPDEFAGQLREARLPVGPSRSPRAASGRLQLDRPATRRH